MTISKKIGAVALIAFLLTSVADQAQACACGCGIFDVSTSSALPTEQGGSMWFEYDYANQSKNWSKTSSIPMNDHSHDKQIRTSYYNMGGQYMFNREWGIKAVVPFLDRTVDTVDHDTDVLFSARRMKIGDVRVTGIYSGFSPDMSSGLTFGLKLPTGDHTDAILERDAAIGSGSTNLLLGGYKMGRIGTSKTYGWFANAVLDTPFLIQDDYRPGAELSAAVGVYHEGWSVGTIGDQEAKFTPVLQLVGSKRWQDGSLEASNHTGYSQLIVSPGMEFSVGKTTFYSDIGIPVYRNVRKHQLVAPVLVKAGIRVNF